MITRRIPHFSCPQRPFLKVCHVSLTQPQSSLVHTTTTTQLLLNQPKRSRLQTRLSLSQCSLQLKSRTYASSPTADTIMESLNDLYGTARDEFEIASEETLGKTIYAADDRAAAVEAFKALKEGYENAVQQGSPEVAKEVQGRVGARIRELESAIAEMERLAMED